MAAQNQTSPRPIKAGACLVLPLDLLDVGLLRVGYAKGQLVARNVSVRGSEIFEKLTLSYNQGGR